MPKNICIFSDGTGQGGSVKAHNNTNVFTLYTSCKAADPSGQNQVCFYDPGLGSKRDGPDIGWLRWAYNKVSQATGLGISQNIKDCYRFLIQVYEPGDRLFLFGFSRGAYTVRSLGGVLKLCGIPSQNAKGVSPKTSKHVCESLVEEAVETVYKTYGQDDATRQKRIALGVDYRTRYNAHEIAPYFIGVWDTVRALGLPGTNGMILWRHAFHDAGLDARVPYARQALAIDENRDVFAPVLWEETPEDRTSQRIKQMWFAGVHSDVGGSYRERGLSDITLSWIVEEARQIETPLLVEPLKLAPDPLGLQHDELRYGLWRKGLRRLSGHDVIAEPAVKQRFEAQGVPVMDEFTFYRPEGLRHHPDFKQYY